METKTLTKAEKAIADLKAAIGLLDKAAHLVGDTRVSGRLSDIASDLDSVLSGAILEAIQI